MCRYPWKVCLGGLPPEVGLQALTRQPAPSSQHEEATKPHGTALLVARQQTPGAPPSSSEGTAKETSTWDFPLLFMISHHAVWHYRGIITFLFICEINMAHDTYLVGMSRISEEGVYTSPQIINVQALLASQAREKSGWVARWGPPDAYCMPTTLLEIHHCIFS